MFKKVLSIISFMLFSASALATQYPEVLNITYVKAPFNIQNMVMKNHQLLEKEFQKEGIKINWIPIKAGLNQVRGMAAGEIDMVAAMNTTTLMIANSVGNRIVIVGGVAHPDETFAVVAMPNIAKDISDFKGKTIVGPKGTVLHHLLTLALDKSQLKMSDVHFVSMNLPSSLTTLLAGKADAALVAAGGLLKAQEHGFKTLVSAKGMLSTNLVLAARGTFADQYPEVVERVAKVNKQALIWAQQNRQQAVALGAKEHKISEKEANALYDWSAFYSDLTQKDIQAMKDSQAFLLQEKMMSQPVVVESLIKTTVH